MSEEVDGKFGARGGGRVHVVLEEFDHVGFGESTDVFGVVDVCMRAISNPLFSFGEGARSRENYRENLRISKSKYSLSI